mgnify:CR=1 FL=1
MILIVEDINRWEDLLVGRVQRTLTDEEIEVARSVSDLKKVLSSNQKFRAVALDGWLGENSTLEFISDLLKISKVVISTSQDVEMRQKMISAGCHAGGNKWDFIPILQILSS